MIEWLRSRRAYRFTAYTIGLVLAVVVMLPEHLWYASVDAWGIFRSALEDWWKQVRWISSLYKRDLETWH